MQDLEDQYGDFANTAADPYFLEYAGTHWSLDRAAPCSLLNQDADIDQIISQSYPRPVPGSRSQIWPPSVPARHGSPHQLNPKAQDFRPGERLVIQHDFEDPLLSLERSKSRGPRCPPPAFNSGLPCTPFRLGHAGEILPLRPLPFTGSPSSDEGSRIPVLYSDPMTGGGTVSTPGTSISGVLSPSSIKSEAQSQRFAQQPLYRYDAGSSQSTHGDVLEASLSHSRQTQVDAFNQLSGVLPNQDIESWTQDPYAVGYRSDPFLLQVPQAIPTRPSLGRGLSGVHTTSQYASPWSCSHDDCDRVCASKSDLEHHQRCHGPRNHVCSLCGKGFVYHKDLKRHNKIHDRADRHFFCNYTGCRYCTTGFQRKDHLDRHVKTHARSAGGSQAMSRNGSQF